MGKLSVSYSRSPLEFESLELGVCWADGLYYTYLLLIFRCWRDLISWLSAHTTDSQYSVGKGSVPWALLRIGLWMYSKNLRLIVRNLEARIRGHSYVPPLPP
jgi:hypothetical protein